MNSTTATLDHVAVVACGGTIQNTRDGRIGVQALIESLPSDVRASLPRVEIDDVLRVGSEDLEPADWTRVAEAVDRAALRPDIRGVVVTHGTYTAEETAYFLHLTVRTMKPIVMACSQRRHGVVGNDGDRNLVDALRVAAGPAAAGKGVLLVMSEEIHGARDVRKTNQRPGGFSSGRNGILGSIEHDQVTFYRTPSRRHTAGSEFADRAPDPLPRVDIVMTYPGADGAPIPALIAAGARGIVVHGYAPQGRPHKRQAAALEQALAQGIAVVLTSRGGEGRVAYDERLPAAGAFIGGDNLSPQKARVLLMLALGRATSTTDLHRVFHQY